MKTYINFFKKVRSNFNNYMEQFRINLFKYESHEIIVGDRTSRYAGNNSTRDTIFLISSPDSMNAIDYTPTRFKCAVNAIDEYIRLRTKLSSGDRIGVVYFNNEARFIFHLMKPNELVLEWGEEFEPRGTIYMEKGFGGVNRILKRQKKFAEETFTVLITDSPEPVDGCMRCTDQLMKKYDIKLEVVALNLYSAFVDESTGFRQFVAHNTQDLIEHIRLLAENQV